MKTIKHITVFALLAFSVGSTYAADVEKGKTLAVQCAACHGAAGISHSPIWPNLAGQKAAYLDKQLKDFRSGKRNDPMMTMMAKPLSDDDIADLSAYFASLE